jgi:hypothetical protein
VRSSALTVVSWEGVGGYDARVLAAGTMIDRYRVDTPVGRRRTSNAR